MKTTTGTKTEEDGIVRRRAIERQLEQHAPKAIGPKQTVRKRYGPPKGLAL